MISDDDVRGFYGLGGQGPRGGKEGTGGSSKHGTGGKSRGTRKPTGGGGGDGAPPLCRLPLPLANDVRLPPSTTLTPPSSCPLPCHLEEPTNPPDYSFEGSRHSPYATIECERL